MKFSDYDAVLSVIEKATEEDLKKIEEMIKTRREDSDFILQTLKDKLNG